MTEEPRKVATIDYSAPDPSVERRWHRILLCIGMTLGGFGIGTISPTDTLLKGAMVGVGAFLVALVLPVRE
jgi:hypothetical protein